MASTSSLINRENAKIVAEFHALKEISYIPEYLEIILLNLITNAIKYKHPGRKPVIYIQTYLKNETSFLEVSDNGLGIDLDQYGDKMFGMYKPFMRTWIPVVLDFLLQKIKWKHLGVQFR